MDLLQREADYKRLNEELEAKTTSLFQETESMLRQQEEYLAAAAELETQGPDYYVDPRIEGDEDDEERDYGFSQALGRQTRFSLSYFILALVFKRALKV